MERVSNKIALITGGNSGIGFASAKALVENGAQVVITGRDQSKLNDAKAELGEKCLAIRSDVANLEDIDNLFLEIKNKFGYLDILFANAGVADVLGLSEATESHFDRLIDVNVKGLFFTVQKSLPLLRDGASIILNASIAKDKGFEGMSVYSATKAAVRSFTRTWTSELKDRSIRVNSISPGPIETPIYDRMGLPEEAKTDFASSIASLVPMGRFGRAEDIGNAVVFLGSDDSIYITGTDLVIDGGLSQV